MYSEWRWITVWYKRTNGAKIPKKVEIEDSETKRELKINRVLTKVKKNGTIVQIELKIFRELAVCRECWFPMFFYGSLCFHTNGGNDGNTTSRAY